jgi:hypothetical protein
LIACGFAPNSSGLTNQLDIYLILAKWEKLALTLQK